MSGSERPNKISTLPLSLRRTLLQVLIALAVLSLDMIKGTSEARYINVS